MTNQSSSIFSDSDRIQTCNLLIRSQMLYSVELRSRLQHCCLFLVLVLYDSDFLLLDTSLLTREFTEIEDTCATNFTHLVELD